MPNDTRGQLVAWMEARLGKFAYSQLGDRLHPDQTGHTDCSGLVAACYRDVAGMDIGTWTGNELDHGSVLFDSSADYGKAISVLQPGDLVFFNWDHHNPTFDHVEMYIGNESTCGHGGDPVMGPVNKSFKQLWSEAYEIVSRRYLDVSVVGTGTYKFGPNGIDIYEIMSDGTLRHVSWAEWVQLGQPMSKITNPGAQFKPSTPAPQIVPDLLPWPSWIPANEYFGLVTGPDASHGGFYERERPYIKRIQQRLVAKGYAPETHDVNSPLCDGIFEDMTARWVSNFQRKEMPGTQYYGQVWQDDYQQLGR